jgi:hypothetical protein
MPCAWLTASGGVSNTGRAARRPRDDIRQLQGIKLGVAKVENATERSEAAQNESD